MLQETHERNTGIFHFAAYLTFIEDLQTGRPLGCVAPDEEELKDDNGKLK